MGRPSLVTSGRTRQDPRVLWSAALAPAGAAVLGGLLQPVLQFPAAIAAAIVGYPALLALPLGVLGAMVGAAYAAAREGDVKHGANTGAAGFAAGGLIAGLAGASPPLDYGWLLVVGATGGVGLAFSVPARPSSRITIAVAMAVLVPVALLVACPTCSIGGG